MKAVILAGGSQSTLSRAGDDIPKPMIEIGGKPLLWHIMKHFSQYGIHEFIVCGGYKVERIKEYFLDYYIYESDITVDLASNQIQIHKKKTEDWTVTVVDTGLSSSVGQRLCKVAEYLPEESFLVTYGDCLSDLDILSLIEHHQKAAQPITVVMAKPAGRKQVTYVDENSLMNYDLSDSSKDYVWVKTDCFIMEKSVLAGLHGDCDLETQLFRAYAGRKQLAAYRHPGYWSTIETMRDLVDAEQLWNQGMAPWVKDDDI